MMMFAAASRTSNSNQLAQQSVWHGQEPDQHRVQHRQQQGPFTQTVISSAAKAIKTERFEQGLTGNPLHI
jgi:hypothetical protein